MVWGFHVPGISRTIANARVETAAEKASFRDSWAAHRCVIPASWYYEWQHYNTPDGRTRTGEKYAIQPKDSEVTWLAGLYRFEETNGFKYPVFVVLTRAPCEAVSGIHDRMPLILPENAVDEWIAPNGKPEEVAKAAITDLAVERA